MSGVRHLTIRHLRLWLGLFAGMAVALLAPPAWSPLVRTLAAWNGGVFIFLALMFTWMLRLDAARVHARYREGDPAAFIFLLIVTGAALASLVAIIALLATVRHAAAGVRAGHLALAAITLAMSWTLVATMFTLHYAHLYYRPGHPIPPLRFPDTERPVFWDFIYFSVTIAAACQTSDVSTMDTAARRVVTAQTLVSFLFNLAILGFAVNVSAGLLA